MTTMKWQNTRAALGLIGLMFCVSSAAWAAPSVGELTVNERINPMGIDDISPRLSWIITSTERNTMQVAYQVIVASSADKANKHEGDLWDSGRVASQQSAHVKYAGRKLRSFEPCWWSVRIWVSIDGKASSEPTAWSKPATWSMGVLNASDWGAKWIGHTAPPAKRYYLTDVGPLVNFDGCGWMWHDEGKSLAELPAGNRYFRYSFNLPADDAVRFATLLIAADDRYFLFVNGKRYSISRDEPEAWRQGYEVDLTHKLQAGRNALAVQVNNNAVGPAGVAGKLVIELNSGRRIVQPIDASWKSTAGPKGHWIGAEYDDAAWKPAKFVAQVGDSPWGIVPAVGYAVGWLQTAPSPLLRRTFDVADKPVKRATAYICGIGYHELRLNGQKIGDRELDPAFTRFDRRTLYVTHDVTDQIHKGANALGVMLGNGWQNMHTRATWDFDQAPWRAEPRAMMLLRIEYADGSTQNIVTDESWRASTGALVADSIRAGNIYDARLEKAGWDTPQYDDAAWAKASLVDAPVDAKMITAMSMDPIRVTQTIKPAKLTQVAPGVWVYDMGQNIPGWAELHITGKAGSSVTLAYSELLHEDGTIDPKNIDSFVFAGPFQVDTYVLKGGGEEVWSPKFVYHGFRYVQVTARDAEGKPDTSFKPTLSTLIGKVVHTDFDANGSFTCSNELLNDIQRLTLWSYRGNYHGYPTDCPQREKNGWTGDAHLAAEQAMFNWRNIPGYAKWARDLDDEQKPDGNLPGIVPTGGWGYAWGNGPAWDSAFVLIPWYVYLYRGDTQMLADHYDGMKLYVDYMTSRSKDHRVSHGLGDWCPADTKTPAEITSTGYYYVDAMIVSKAAKLLGHDNDARNYAALAERIRASFNKQFYKGDGRYEPLSQTSLSCAIHQGLAEPSQVDAVRDRLVEAVHTRKDHLDVGILGFKYLLRSLSEHGRADLAYRIVTQTDFPSFGHWLKQDATTLWEAWDGGGSHNHIMFGDVSAWFYQTLAGINIDPARPGFKHIILRPQPVGDLNSVQAQTNSAFGPIRSQWQRVGNRFTWHVSIPANTTATVCVPTTQPDSVTESGKPVKGRHDGTGLMIELGSGEYDFASTLGQPAD
ncbi:family 78 glycoside hydrolase catalytic domain [Planctomycetales bacterium ZRK34]|nr:family 78 glycoside hydrolase catalytic domain [Planctomycetales bacterium ZRK34]